MTLQRYIGRYKWTRRWQLFTIAAIIGKSEGALLVRIREIRSLGDGLARDALLLQLFERKLRFVEPRTLADFCCLVTKLLTDTLGTPAPTAITDRLARSGEGTSSLTPLALPATLSTFADLPSCKDCRSFHV